MGALAAEVGFANAVVETFGDANIEVEVEGDISPAAGQGLIVAGDHRQRIEPLLVQALMGKSEREASRVVAMPTSFAGRLMQSSSAQGRELIIPVIPGACAAENKPSLRHPRDVVRRMRYPEVLNRPKDDLRAINARAIATAAQTAAGRGSVTIFPTGGDATWRWHKGLGHIIGQLPTDARETTQVAVFRPDTFPIKKVLAALALRDAGIRSKKQTIVLRAGLLGNVNDLFGSAFTADNPEAAQRISDLVREGYVQQFGSQAAENASLLPQATTRSIAA